MKTASLDACCILRWLLQDIPEQAQAVHDLLSNPGSYHLADTSLMEVVYVLERIYKQERYFIASCLNLISSLNQIKCSRHLIKLVIPINIWKTLNSVQVVPLIRHIPNGIM